MREAARQIDEKKVWAQRSPAFAGAGSTHGDAAPVFEATEHDLDFMALFIQDFIVVDRDFSVLFAGDTGNDPFLHQSRTEPIRIIPPIGQELPRAGQRRQQQGGALVITHLTFG